jgi:hypothetical protein
MIATSGRLAGAGSGAAAAPIDWTGERTNAPAQTASSDLLKLNSRPPGQEKWARPAIPADAELGFKPMIVALPRPRENK